MFKRLIIKNLEGYMKKIVKFFDKLEDVVRIKLSHFPILYGLIGGFGVVWFWRGVWHTGDFLTIYLATRLGYTDMHLESFIWWDGPLSIVVGAMILLITGLLVSTFIGNEIIITGLKRQKRIAEKTEEEIDSEADTIFTLHKELHEIARREERLEKFIDKNKKE